MFSLGMLSEWAFVLRSKLVKNDNRICVSGMFRARPEGGDRFIILVFGRRPEGAKPPERLSDVPDGNYDLKDSRISSKEAGLERLKELRRQSSDQTFYLYDENGLVAESQATTA